MSNRSAATGDSANIVEVRAVTRAYPGPPPRLVLADLSLNLRRGEMLAIVGESGSGKSTLLNLIAGLDRPDAGTISVDGVDLRDLDDDALTRLRRDRIGFVFQAFHVLPYLSVAQNVALPLALQAVAPASAAPRVAAMLDAVGLAARAASMPRELSGGELQRVAIARALVHQPALVLADEPTGNLDADNAAAVLALLRERTRATGVTCVLATHSAAAAATADRVLRLGRDGRFEAA